MPPTVLILRTAGTNCDQETAHAFELAGASARFLHIGRLLENPSALHDYQILAIPGGFSYGDDISSGRIFASQINKHLAEPLRRFVDAGKPVIGICNGFQVLIKTELLPGPPRQGSLPGVTSQSATLTHNDGGRFIDRWVHLKPLSHKCIWTAPITQHSALRTLHSFQLPIAHGEGKFVFASQLIRRELWENDQVALVYTTPDGSPAHGESPHNPNGSIDDIAGICDPTGLVFGLMPHPERHVTPYQHPAWSTFDTVPPEAIGLSIFRNAVGHAASAVGAGV